MIGFRRARARLLAALAAWSALVGAASAERVVFHHDGVLGTALEIVVVAHDPAVATAAERAVLEEIDRLAAVASTYDTASEVSRWLAAGTPRPVSHDLAAILHTADRWREASAGAFHPGVAAATLLWTEAERAAAPPSPARLGAVAEALADPPWHWQGDLVAPGAGPITLDAVATGVIVDAACRAALAVPGVSGVMVNIGGDLAVRGALEQAVVVGAAAPGRAGGTLDEVVVADLALTTSGDAFKGFGIGGRWYSHVIDPRTALPAGGARQATVIAPVAADADALATILCVLPPDEGLALVERTAGASCLIVGRDGAVRASRGWPGRRHGGRTVARPVAARQDGAGAPATEVVLDLEINRPAGGRRYRRPYVAAWIEDADGFPVKTLLLWVQPGGERWLPDLTRWHRADRLRKLAEETDLVATISEPTRAPGRHAVTWDGRDNAGIALPPGDYTFCLEAAREHGTHQFERRPVTLGKPFAIALPANEEIAAATLRSTEPAAP